MFDASFGKQAIVCLVTLDAAFSCIIDETNMPKNVSLALWVQYYGHLRMTSKGGAKDKYPFFQLDIQMPWVAFDFFKPLLNALLMELSCLQLVASAQCESLVPFAN